MPRGRTSNPYPYPYPVTKSSLTASLLSSCPTMTCVVFGTGVVSATVVGGVYEASGWADVGLVSSSVSICVRSNLVVVSGAVDLTGVFSFKVCGGGVVATGLVGVSADLSSMSMSFDVSGYSTTGSGRLFIPS